MNVFVKYRAMNVFELALTHLDHSVTNLWLQVALISSPVVHSYGEDHPLSSQVWQMPFRSQ